eukprot:UN06449
MLCRLSPSTNPISKDATLPKLIKTTNHAIQSTITHNPNLHINKLNFSLQHHINTNSINLIKCSKVRNINVTPNRFFHIHSLRSFSKKAQPSHWQRTFNPGLKQFYRDLGFNANPWKVGICGAFGGLCGALCGVGGGIVMIPLLRYITTMTAHQIAGTSLVAVAAGALIATANYTLSSDVTRVPIALNIALFSMAFSALGAKTNSMLMESC